MGFYKKSVFLPFLMPIPQGCSLSARQAVLHTAHLGKPNIPGKVPIYMQGLPLPVRC